MGILDAFRLDGKVALVTGASRGLGQAIALGFAEAGAEVAGLDRSGANSDTGQKIEAVGHRFISIQGDLNSSTVADLNTAVRRVVDEFGRLDILVNNAGIIRRRPALEYTEEDWDALLQINLKSAFFLSQAAGKVMASQGGGKIINVASVLSFQGGILVPAYTAAKSGLLGITRALANEWAALNINVNGIAPGYMVTDNTTAIRADEARNAAIVARIPAGRWGRPEELQGAAVFLASSASNYMHGAIISVDGGWLSR
jgi:2-dehydro-3-deoxy-D-gluconate 5-dehydrogenase